MEETPSGTIRFIHDKIRESIYATLDGTERQKLHLAVAHYLEAGDEGDERDLRSMARHWEAGGEIEKAKPWYRKAARQAVEQNDIIEADALYRTYLSLFPEPTIESMRTQIEWC